MPLTSADLVFFLNKLQQINEEEVERVIKTIHIDHRTNMSTRKTRSFGVFVCNQK